MLNKKKVGAIESGRTRTPLLLSWEGSAYSKMDTRVLFW